jgi:hypothetical protein
VCSWLLSNNIVLFIIISSVCRHYMKRELQKGNKSEKFTIWVFAILVFFCNRRVLPSWYSTVTEEYQDGENSYCECFGLAPFLQLAIHIWIVSLITSSCSALVAALCMIILSYESTLIASANNVSSLSYRRKGITLLFYFYNWAVNVRKIWKIK